MNKRLYAALAIPLTLAGCATPNPGKIKDTRAVPSYSAPVPTAKAAEQINDQDSYRYSDPGRSFSLTLKNADLNDVLILLSKESGVPIVAEKGLRGTVRIEAGNRKLGELLYLILKPLGYTATVENGMILVGRPKLTTRTFRMNYLKDTRNSSSNMNVAGFAAGSSGGSVTVSTTGKTDFWGALESSLEMLVFGTSGKGKREGGGYSVSEVEKKNGDSKTTSGDRKNGASDSDDPLLSSTLLNDNMLKQLVVNEIAGIIQVTDFNDNLDKIASFLKDVEEGSKRQVMIQAHIMEVTLSDSYSMGVDWNSIMGKTNIITNLIPGSASGSSVMKIGGAGDKLSVVMEALKEQGNLNMLSSPKITALNNQKAVIKLTTKEVSWITSKTSGTTTGSGDTFTTTPQIDEVGIFLDVTPQIGQDGSVIMQVHPSISAKTDTSVAKDGSTKPIIDIREIDTMVDAKAGETIVIAGLISDKLSESKRGVPVLEDIPYMGALFSYSKQTRAKTELVIMMTPYFLNGKSIDEIRKEHEKRLQNIGGDFHLINNMGSLITEKSSRDWIMRSEPHRKQPAPEPAAPTVQEQSSAIVPTVPAAAESTTPAASVIAPQPTVTQAPAQSATAPAAQKEQSLSTKLQQEQAGTVQKINVIPTAVTEPALKGETSVKTVSVTSDSEQVLYRSAVTAYKIGDCAESIKAFDTFARHYPDSPFLNDAAYYRKDCADRLVTNTTN